MVIRRFPSGNTQELPQQVQRHPPLLRPAAGCDAGVQHRAIEAWPGARPPVGCHDFWAKKHLGPSGIGGFSDPLLISWGIGICWNIEVLESPENIDILECWNTGLLQIYGMIQRHVFVQGEQDQEGVRDGETCCGSWESPGEVRKVRIAHVYKWEKDVQNIHYDMLLINQIKSVVYVGMKETCIQKSQCTAVVGPSWLPPIDWDQEQPHRPPTFRHQDPIHLDSILF